MRTKIYFYLLRMMICGRYGAYVFVYTIIIIYLFQIESVRFLNGKFLLNCMDFFIILTLGVEENKNSF